MMDRRQPDDVNALMCLPLSDNSKSKVIHRYVWLIFDNPLDSRIATIANHARGLWAGSMGQPSLRK
jgi:hypothetical protein